MTLFSDEIPSNLYKLETNIKLGGDFSVSWLCNCELSFSKLTNIKANMFNPKIFYINIQKNI